MGFRFQKRIKIMPGVTINLSRRGLSTSVGVPGARITRGHGKTRVTMGIPGSGLSHSQVLSNRKKRNSSPMAASDFVQLPERKGFPRIVKAVAFAFGVFVLLLVLAPFMRR